MAVEGIEEVHFTVRFRVPPGMDSAKVAQLISQGGVCVSVGLMVHAIDAKCTVVPAGGPKLV